MQIICPDIQKVQPSEKRKRTIHQRVLQLNYLKPEAKRTVVKSGRQKKIYYLKSNKDKNRIRIFVRNNAT